MQKGRIDYFFTVYSREYLVNICILAKLMENTKKIRDISE